MQESQVCLPPNSGSFPPLLCSTEDLREIKALSSSGRKSGQGTGGQGGPGGGLIWGFLPSAPGPSGHPAGP